MASTPKRTSTSKAQSASKDAAFSTATATPETPEQAAKVLVSTAIPVAGAELPLTKAQLEGKYRLRISADVDHPFRLMSITRFGGRRSPVSVMAIRRFG